MKLISKMAVLALLPLSVHSHKIHTGVKDYIDDNTEQFGHFIMGKEQLIAFYYTKKSIEMYFTQTLTQLRCDTGSGSAGNVSAIIDFNPNVNRRIETQFGNDDIIQPNKADNGGDFGSCGDIDLRDIKIADDDFSLAMIASKAVCDSVARHLNKKVGTLVPQYTAPLSFTLTPDGHHDTNTANDNSGNAIDSDLFELSEGLEFHCVKFTDSNAKY